jgi:hypothetical protein
MSRSEGEDWHPLTVPSKGRKWEVKEGAGVASKDVINGARTQPHFHLWRNGKEILTLRVTARLAFV